MNRKYLISFIAGLSFVALVGATFKSLMLDESGNCSQSVNFTGTTTLNSAAIATQAYSSDVVSSHNSDGSAHSSVFAAKLTASNNLSDVSSASTARSNLGLGTAATQSVGTSAGNVVQLDGSAKLPAVDGSALTNLPASGESNTASNVGTGTGIFAQKSGVDLQFKSLIAGTNIEITYDSTGITIAATGSASGEANTASNIGAGGVGVFAQKSSVDLQFKNIIAGSNKVLVSDDTADSEIAIDVQPGNIAHQDLSGAGTNTHTQIDSHISSTSNPHSVTASQVGALSTAGAAEINGLTEKTTPADNDEIIIEDSAASYAKKKVKISNLPSGSGGGLSWSKITASATASSGNGYLIDPASAVTLTLPASPSAGDQVGIKAIDLDYAVVIARNSSNIEGAASDMNIDVSGAGFTLVYVDATTGWTVVDAIPTSTSSSGSGGMWTLVERWEPTTVATSYTFSGLNGNVDRCYMIRAKIVKGTNAADFRISPNNTITTSYYRQALEGINTSVTAARLSFTGFDLGYTGDCDLNICEVVIWAKTGTMRMSRCEYGRFLTTGPTAMSTVKTHIFWSDTSTNITSLVFRSEAGTASCYGVGTSIELWKLAQ